MKLVRHVRADEITWRDFVKATLWSLGIGLAWVVLQAILSGWQDTYYEGRTR